MTIPALPSEGDNDWYDWATGIDAAARLVGLLPTGTADPGSPATGYAYFNTVSEELRVWGGTAWFSVALTEEIPVGAYTTEVLADAPVGYWKLDETSGTAISDSSGNGYHGTLIGSPTLGVTGAPSGLGAAALRLSGSGQYAQITGTNTTPHALGLNGSAWSIEAWFRDTDSGSSGFRTLVSRGDSSWRTQKDSGVIKAGVNGLGSGDPSTGFSSGDSAWHHLVWTFDGANVKGYVDNSLLVTSARTGTVNTTSHYLLIGENAQSTGRYWQGDLAHVALYDTALSATRIGVHYTAGTT